MINKNTRIYRVSFSLNEKERKILNNNKLKQGYSELSSYIRDTLLYRNQANSDQIKSKVIFKLSELGRKLKNEQAENQEELMALNKMKKIIIEELIDLIKNIG